jgi:hypothetical protein
VFCDRLKTCCRLEAKLVRLMLVGGAESSLDLSAVMHRIVECRLTS